ncbi:MAG TPA: DUF4381 domain-containing protein [Chitinophagaceae bacterium]|jgi:hypothetical protein
MDEQYGQLIEPEKVLFTFGAPGWYVLGVLILLLIAALAWLIYRNYQKNLYRKNALKWLAAEEANYANSNAPIALLYETNMLLKRIAIARYGRSMAAGIRGNEWIVFLNKSRGKPLFDEKEGYLLQNELYAAGTSDADYSSVNIFLNKAKEWIRKHKHSKALKELG